MANVWDNFGEHLVSIIVVTLIFGGWIFVAVTKSITENWRKVREAEQTAALKQSMVEKGMSADEIERVLKAGAPPKV